MSYLPFAVVYSQDIEMPLLLFLYKLLDLSAVYLLFVKELGKNTINRLILNEETLYLKILSTLTIVLPRLYSPEYPKF